VRVPEFAEFVEFVLEFMCVLKVDVLKVDVCPESWTES